MTESKSIRRLILLHEMYRNLLRIKNGQMVKKLNLESVGCSYQ